jgi:hypothetical protein
MAPSGVANVAELTSRTKRAEEDDIVPFAVIVFNHVRLPAARFGISTSQAFDADQGKGSHHKMMARTSEAAHWSERTG